MCINIEPFQYATPHGPSCHREIYLVISCNYATNLMASTTPRTEGSCTTTTTTFVHFARV